MIVVADTSPLNYLVQLGLPRLLESLYGRVQLTRVVLDELRAQGAPEAVKQWAWDLPMWVDVHHIPERSNASWDALDPGERSAIHLATHLRANLLLIDERKAGLVAQSLGFTVTGTLGVLRDAHIAGVVDGVLAYEALTARTNFRQTEAVRRMFLQSLPS